MADPFSEFEFSTEVKSARRKLWVASGTVVPLILGISAPDAEKVITVLGTNFDGSRQWLIFLIAGALVLYLLLIFVLRLREEWFKVTSVAPLVKEIQQMSAVVDTFNNHKADKDRYNQLIESMDIPTLTAKLRQEYVINDGLASIALQLKNVNQLTGRKDLNKDHKEEFTNGIWRILGEIENDMNNMPRVVEETNARLDMIDTLLSRTTDYFSIRYPENFEKLMSNKQKTLKNGSLSIKFRWIVLEAIIPTLFGFTVFVVCGIRVFHHF